MVSLEIFEQQVGSFLHVLLILLLLGLPLGLVLLEPPVSLLQVAFEAIEQVTLLIDVDVDCVVCGCQCVHICNNLLYFLLLLHVFNTVENCEGHKDNHACEYETVDLLGHQILFVVNAGELHEEDRVAALALLGDGRGHTSQRMGQEALFLAQTLL